MGSTTGKLVLDNWGKNEAPECREVTNESWWKSFHPRLKKEIEGYKGSKDLFYLMLSIKNEGLLGHNVKHATWLLFEEMPPPKASSVLWSYKKSSEELRIEWTLPDEDSINEICDIPDTYDPKLVRDCMEYKKTQKVPVRIDPNARPKTKVLLP